MLDKDESLLVISLRIVQPVRDFEHGRLHNSRYPIFQTSFLSSEQSLGGFHFSRTFSSLLLISFIQENMRPYKLSILDSLL